MISDMAFNTALNYMPFEQIIDFLENNQIIKSLFVLFKFSNNCYFDICFIELNKNDFN